MSHELRVTSFELGTLTQETQREIARRLSPLFRNIDLGIPAQRAVALEVIDIQKNRLGGDEVIVDALDDSFWIDRESERVEEIEAIRSMILGNESYWWPNPLSTIVEVLWDKARMDAFEEASRLQLKGEVIDARAIALQASISSGLTDGDVPRVSYYNDSETGATLPTGMIDFYNESMILHLFARPEVTV